MNPTVAIEILDRKRRNLLVGYLEAVGQLTAGERWPGPIPSHSSIGVSSKVYEVFEAAAKEAGIAHASLLCWVLGELSGDGTNAVVWNLAQWARTRHPTREDWVRLWKGR